MKKLFLCLAVAMVIVSGCGNDSGDNVTAKENTPPSLEQFDKDETILAYFAEKNVTIKDMELEKRQTNMQEKNDIAYLYISADNGVARLEGIYVVETNYYDVGGWIVDRIYPEGHISYQPMGIPEISLTVDGYDCNVELINMELSDEGKHYTAEYELLYSGNIATCALTCIVEGIFYENEGIWKTAIREGIENYVIEDSYKQYSSYDIGMLFKIQDNLLYPVSYIDAYMYEDEHIDWEIDSKVCEMRTSNEYEITIPVKFAVNEKVFDKEVKLQLPYFVIEIESLDNFLSGTVEIIFDIDSIHVNNLSRQLNEIREIDESKCVKVPNLTYMTSDEAKAAVENVGLRLRVGMFDVCFGACSFEEGQITDQNIAPGEYVPSGTEIVVSIDKEWSFSD